MSPKLLTSLRENKNLSNVVVNSSGHGLEVTSKSSVLQVDDDDDKRQGSFKVNVRTIGRLFFDDEEDEDDDDVDYDDNVGVDFTQSIGLGFSAAHRGFTIAKHTCLPIVSVSCVFCVLSVRCSTSVMSRQCV